MKPKWRYVVEKRYIPIAMKLLLLFSYLFLALHTGHVRKPNNDNKFEFSKSVYKIKATIRKSDGDYVIVPDDSRDDKFIPAYLPDEYRKNGLAVTFDGDLGKADKAGTALNIHKIWVAYELKEKYKLVHKEYNLN
jgi:hypothetical protein